MNKLLLLGLMVLTANIHSYNEFRSHIIDAKIQSHCTFCSEVLSPHDKRHFILQRRSRCIIKLDEHAPIPGTILIIPYLHTPAVDGLLRTTFLDVSAAVYDVCRIMRLVAPKYNVSICPDLDHLCISIIPEYATLELLDIIEPFMIEELICDMYDRYLKYFSEDKDGK